MSFTIVPQLLLIGAGVGIGMYINSGSLVCEPELKNVPKIKFFNIGTRQKIAFAVGLVCLLIVISSFLLFYFGNYKNVDYANLVLNSASYITTTFALIIALLFLDFD